MTPQLTRLYLGTVAGGATVYTATQRTVVRTIDITIASAGTNVYIKVNDDGSDFVNVVAWYSDGGTPTYRTDQWYLADSIQWRGGLVLNPGDYLYIYLNTASASWATVCGVVGV